MCWSQFEQQRGPDLVDQTLDCIIISHFLSRLSPHSIDVQNIILTKHHHHHRTWPGSCPHCWQHENTWGTLRSELISRYNAMTTVLMGLTSDQGKVSKLHSMLKGYCDCWLAGMLLLWEKKCSTCWNKIASPRATPGNFSAGIHELQPKTHLDWLLTD